jgi:hypothetical protein
VEAARAAWQAAHEAARDESAREAAAKAAACGEEEWQAAEAAEATATGAAVTEAAANEAEAAEALVDATPSAPGVGDDEEPPDEFVCPITQEVMDDPAVAADGHTYERAAIERWMARKMTSPKTGEEFESAIIFPNHSTRRQLREWQEKR